MREICSRSLSKWMEKPRLKSKSAGFLGQRFVHAPLICSSRSAPQTWESVLTPFSLSCHLVSLPDMTSDTSSSAPASLPPGRAQALPCLTWLPDGAS